MEFKGSNFILFSKSQCCTCIFSSYYQEIKRYLSISFCFLKLCCINASRLLLFCVFIDGDFWGVNTYSTLPLLLWSHRRSRYTVTFHSTNTLSVNQYWVSLVSQDCRQRSLATLCLRVHINKRNF